MNKKQLINTVADKTGTHTKDATAAVNAVLEAIQEAVASGDKVALVGFGAFDLIHKAARTARNPSTGEPVNVAESWTPKFRPGSDFKNLVTLAARVQQDGGQG